MFGDSVDHGEMVIGMFDDQISVRAQKGLESELELELELLAENDACGEPKWNIRQDLELGRANEKLDKKTA